MSGILGVFNKGHQPVEESLVQRLLGRMSARGEDHSQMWRVDGAALAVARNAWELEDGFSGDVLVVAEGDLVIAADASIYYRKELRDKLTARGERFEGTTPSHLILAAYRAWGEQCLQYLEGDYAFIMWDRAQRRVFCARDFAGRRPLYYADLGHSLVVASTLSAVIAHPRCPDDFNLEFLTETAAALWPSAHETTYQAVNLIPAGSRLSLANGGAAQRQQYWYPPEIESGSGPPFEDAAVELGELVCRAVDERLAPRGVSSVWMSGGCDSTAVFGAGQKVLQGKHSGRVLRPVSVSYPPGDPGREDELITAIGHYWSTPVHWLDIRQIPLFDHVEEGATDRDEPFEHIFELFNRTLARGSRAIGARVALGGGGGDQLFAADLSYLVDLLRTGQWVTLAREWRAVARGGAREFFRQVIKPTLPRSALRAATLLRGGQRLHGYLERWIPVWMDRRWVGRLAERQTLHTPPRRGKSCSAYEMYFGLTCAFFPRVSGRLGALGLEEGVEVRSPLLDERLIRFAATRPHSERRSGRETKLLLRRAMRGMLPAEVLAPRRFKTGVIVNAVVTAMREGYPDLLRSLLNSPVLGELGLIQPGVLQRAYTEYLRHGDGDVALALFSTAQVELWLRARLRPSNAAPLRVPRDTAAVVGAVH
jgi:asparagine synthase (glutamine-hydrolysing)